MWLASLAFVVMVPASLGRNATRALVGDASEQLRLELRSVLLGPREDAAAETRLGPWQTEGKLRYRELSIASRIPAVFVRPASRPATEALPCAILLHCTASWRHDESLSEQARVLAAAGMAVVAPDLPYHGARNPTLSDDEYRNASRARRMAHYTNRLVEVWRGERSERPFVLDGAADCLAVVEFLTRLEGVEASKLGVVGVSLGGMVAWLAAAAEPRIAVAVPLIGVQWFDWAVHNDAFHGRVESLLPLFEAAATDLGKGTVDADVFVQVLDRVSPGLRSRFDAPQTLGLVAPRPLLVVNAELDGRCPVRGVAQAYLDVLEDAYRHAPARFKIHVEPGVGHSVTPDMWRVAQAWLRRYLLEEDVSDDTAASFFPFQPQEDHARAARDYLARYMGGSSI